jgi:HSP20 family protein
MLVKVNPNQVCARPAATLSTDQLVNNLFENFEKAFMGGPSIGFRHTMPAVNIAENADGFRIELAAPGLRKDDFRITQDKNRLSIEVEKSEENKGDEDQYRRREFSYLKFRRSFELPQSADVETIAASYENGILVVSIAKRPEAKPKPSRVIEIA